jgi:hypothetical protein
MALLDTGACTSVVNIDRLTQDEDKRREWRNRLRPSSLTTVLTAENRECSVQGEVTLLLQLEGTGGSEPCTALSMPTCGFALVVGCDHMEAYNWSMEFSSGEVATSQGQVLMRNKKGQPRAGNGPAEGRRAAMMDAGEEKGDSDDGSTSAAEPEEPTESARELARFTVLKCQAHLKELEQASTLGQLQVEVNAG